MAAYVALGKHDSPSSQLDREEPLRIFGIIPVNGRRVYVGLAFWVDKVLYESHTVQQAFLDAFSKGCKIPMWQFRSSLLHLVCFLRSCLCSVAFDVAVGSRTENLISKLGHPESVSTQLVPIVVGDIQHRRDIHRAILLMSLKWYTVIREWGPEHVCWCGKRSWGVFDG